MSDNLPAVQNGGVPALAGTPALGDIDANDIKLQKLYRGEYQADLVQEGTVPVGSIYLATSPDDPEPQVVAKDATAEKEKGVLVHVLRLEKGKSGRIDGEFRTFPFAAEDNPRTQDNGKALDTTYAFTVAIPEIDPEMPVKVHMSKTSSGCAQRIITRLLKHSRTGATHEVAFRLKLKKREAESNGSKYRWFVWTEALEDAKPANVEVAANLLEIVASQPAVEATPTTADAPRI